MNSYLQLKCRSEQQVMNDLTKCVAAKDYTSKRTAGLLHELSFFYVTVSADADGTSAYIHDSVLRDLSTLLVNIKDKKEDQKLIRLVHVLLQHIAEQMQYTQRQERDLATQTRSTPRGDNTTAILLQLSSLLDTVAKSEVTHAFAPRRVSAFKLYSVLCATLRQPERCYSLVSGISSSPAWTMLQLSAKKKKGSDKDLPMHAAVLDASFQIARALVPSAPQILDPLLPQLVAGAFLPCRHAAAACLALFDISPLQVVDAFMAHVGPATVSVNTTDPVATCYLLQLCGKIARLPVGRRQTSAVNLLDMTFDRESKVALGPPIEQHISTRMQDLLLDVCMQKHTFVLSATVASLAPVSVLLTAIDEMTRGQIAPKCFEKVRGGLSPFEIAANGLQLVLQTHARSTLVLHRVCRAVQSVAAAFDLALVEFSAHHLDFFSKITDTIWDLATEPGHPPCLVKESLMALVWLLPRNVAASPSRTASSLKPAPISSWAELLPLLLELPADIVSPVDREDILRALFRRAKLFDVDVMLLTHTTAVLQHWYETRPCHWHGDLFQALWATSAGSDRAFRADVFESPLAVLDYHRRRDDAAAPAVQYAKCLAVAFVASSAVLGDPAFAAMCTGVVLRLAKLATTDDWPVRRAAVAGLLRLLPLAAPRVTPVLDCLRRQAGAHGYGDLLVVG
ncbi:hypothetical protein ACHHYP_12186 [Achlya hypogyna]|uniref:Uncharacterized protein n=1 Tax=Achlya hypogyna TaxID=1202772 RepID=A0A1V9YHJ8_ACHHY|nr:hypothetical protein ACHHYP_12186 [Achlya hypogyna]